MTLTLVALVACLAFPAVLGFAAVLGYILWLLWPAMVSLFRAPPDSEVVND